jgi:hypothetical protein
MAGCGHARMRALALVGVDQYPWSRYLPSIVSSNDTKLTAARAEQ